MTRPDTKPCQHPRARYVDLGPIGRHVCPDCHDIDWKDEWPRIVHPSLLRLEDDR